MLRLENELYEHLRAGGTLAVASRQRAVAVQLAYAQARLAAGDETWPSPDVLPLQALVARESVAQQQLPAVHRRRLTGVEEWVLWRGAALEAGAQLTLLSAGALVDSLRSSDLLLADWDLQQAVLATPEGDWLLRTRQRYRLRREALQALDSEAWRQDSDALAGSVLLAQPEECGEATRRSLKARGAKLYQPPETGGATAQVVVANNSDAEFELMAMWARRQLELDPAARLLLIVPSLSTQVGRIQRFLDEQLHEQTVAGEAETAANFALEGGLPLADSPLVQAALGSLRLAAGQLPFADWAWLLRSKSLGAQHAPGRLELEQAARESGLVTADWVQLASLAAQCSPAVREWFGAVAARVGAWPQQAVPSRWARLFAELWEQLGWPGSATPSSADQQRRLRFDELVGEFASLDESLGVQELGPAIEVLSAWVAAARLEPASGDVPVTLTARLDDPLVSYDAIWVAGMTAETWPPPAEHSGFIAATALQQAGDQRASADGQLALARRSMRHWSRRAGQLIYSWARVSDESPARPSPLLDGLPKLDLQALLAEPRGGLLQCATALEPGGADLARPWPAEVRAPGGTGLLQAQSHCPFKASARWRLACEALQEPVAGVGPLLHGEILHAAMQQLWSELGDWRALRARPSLEWSALISASVRHAMLAARAGKGRFVEALAWEVEKRRCEQLLLAALTAERDRAPFEVVANEQTELLQLGELKVRLRLDRVDELQATEPGAPAPRVLIDYKSGKRVRTDWSSMRPEQLQLQAYAQVVDGLCAAVTMHLYRGGVQWAGVADTAERMPGIPAAEPGWLPLQQQWRAMLHMLAGQFATGVATVDPLKSACKQCELQLLCRVDAEVLADNLASAEDGDE